MITIFQQEILFFPLFPRYTPNNGTFFPSYYSHNRKKFSTLSSNKNDRN